MAGKLATVVGRHDGVRFLRLGHVLAPEVTGGDCIAVSAAGKDGPVGQAVGAAKEIETAVAMVRGRWSLGRPDSVPWRAKAHRVIGELCAESRRKANQNRDGSWCKRHVPYSVPEMAQRLVDCLDRDDEAAAKAIFVWERA